MNIGNLSIEEIKDMRKSGKGWKTIASFCGVSWSYFWKMKKQYGFDDGKRLFDHGKENPSPLTSKVLKKVNALGFETIADYIRSRKLSGAIREEMKAETGMTDYIIEVHTPYDMRYFWHPKRNEKNQITLGKAWLKMANNNADELAKRLESKNKKGIGMFYTPKGLLPEPLNISTGTGNFLRSAADDLPKGLMSNPPYNTACNRPASAVGTDSASDESAGG